MEREFTRKETPLYSGVVKYFPNALAAVSQVSLVGNEQHNPGEELHWDRSKSTDHLDCLMRHLKDAGTVDDDGILHDAKVAWRALAHLETLIEARSKHLSPNHSSTTSPVLLVSDHQSRG